MSIETDPTLLSLILYRVDNDTLKLLARSGLWSQIASEFKNQHFHFLRVQHLVDLPPEFSNWYYQDNSKQNWHQFYNVVASSRSSNPFSNSILFKNQYNYLAVKWLLQTKKYEPSDIEAVLSEAVQVASPETFKLLLDHRKLARHIVAAFDSVVTAGIEAGRVDNLRVLFNKSEIRDAMEEGALDEEFFSAQLFSALLVAVESNQAASLLFLLQRIDVSEEERASLLFSAVRYDAIDVVKLLVGYSLSIASDSVIYPTIMDHAIRDGAVRVVEWLFEVEPTMVDHVSEGIEDHMYTVVSADYLDLLKVLNKLAKYSNQELLRYVSISSEGTEILEYVLASDDIEQADIGRAIQNAVSHNQRFALSILLEDSRSRKLGPLLVGLLYIDNRDMRLDMLQSKYIDLELVSIEHLREISRDLLNKLPDEVREIADEVREIATSPLRSYNDSHFEMLIREIAIKRRSFSYYLDWLIDRTSRPTTSREVRHLIASAAATIGSKTQIVHTSDLFTAYSAFFLLAKESMQDVERVVRVLRDEGASKSGIQKAKLLVGLFLEVRTSEDSATRY
ncbi:Hypothetical protein POVR2_LOCUS65 [uncultured virus]|nr:Hypothetical protein POVR2_LOCUS65 [uncultured virus]